MKSKKITSTYNVHDLSELDTLTQEMFEMAETQAKKAYAPYSNFYVGAAVLLENGEIITGCNQENASYPLSLCAERVALFAAHSKFPTMPIKKLVIIAINPNNPVTVPISPCGACRQVISESEDRSHDDLEVLLKGESDMVYQFSSIKALLPLSFNSSSL